MTSAETKDIPCMKAEPQEEHKWLRKLEGEWTFDSECLMGPDQPPVKSTGSETVRSLGEVWIVSEGDNETPDGQPAKTIMTLGFDPKKNRFVGTFVASVMTHLWIYEGKLENNVLTLDCEGPSFADPSKTSKYQDIIEVKDENHRVLRSQVLGDDGKWTQFMTASYERRR